MPEDSFPAKEDFFNAFIRTAQYITHLTPRQDILTETGNALVRFYGADIVGFFEMKNGELTGHHWILPEGLAPGAVMTGEVGKIASGVFANGFLESRHIDLPDRFVLSFLPIVWENQTTAIMLVGHRTTRPVPDDLLNSFLAIAGLVGTAVSTSVAAFENIAERKRAEDALRDSEERYRTLFTTMLEGFCVIEMVFDAGGRPVDFRFLEINPAFEHQTGLHDAKGRLMRDLAPDHEAHWFEMYGNIALTGEPARCVNEAKALNRWYDVSAFRLGGPESRKVAILFNDITERKKAEDELQHRHNDLNAAYEELTATQEELRQTNDELFRNEQALMNKNEDLLAMNEELRATQEELTRNEQALMNKNEDLLAMNEELRAVQEELTRNERDLVQKNEELGAMNEELTATDEELKSNLDELLRREQELRENEARLREALTEKEVLLSEIHHRVKNNLTAFISLLSLEGSYEDSPAGAALKKDLQNRARSMSLIHETLYRTKKFSSVDMEVYISTLVEQVASSYSTRKALATNVHADGVSLDLHRATPCGLIINELVTNSFKYAFPGSFDCCAVRGEPCTVHVSLSHEEGMYLLKVGDNGVGLPAEFDPLTAKSLGLKLVNFLARHQLRAKVEVTAENGTDFIFRFKE